MKNNKMNRKNKKKHKEITAEIVKIYQIKL